MDPVTTVNLVNIETLDFVHFVKFFPALLAAVILLSIFTVHSRSFYSAWKLTHPKRRIPDPDIPAQDKKLRFEYVTFREATGKLALKGCWFPAGESKKTVILCHGYQQNRFPFGALSLDFIKGFIELGYNVLTFDFRNCGKSEGRITSVGFYERQDLAGAINWARQKGSSRIYVWGVSMGAATGIITAAENKAVNGVIADCPFADLETYLKKNLPLWSNLPSWPFTRVIMFYMKLITGIDSGRVSPVRALEVSAPIPVLFIHSRDDSHVPVSDSRLMYRKYSRLNPGNAFIWDVHSAPHARSYEMHPEEYMKKVAEFLSHCEKANQA